MDEQVVRVTELVTDARLPVHKPVRNVDLNQDNAALAQIDKAR